MSIHIRPTSLEDLFSLSQLFNRYLNHLGEKNNFADCILFMEKRLSKQDSKIFVAEDTTQKKIVGFAQLYPTQKQVWHFSDRWVDDPYRRQGIAKQLMKASGDYSFILKVETLALYRLNYGYENKLDLPF